MEGYLYKWINFVYRWKLRYFILHNGILIICDKKGSPKKGSIHLQISTIILFPNDPCRITIDSGSREVHLKAKSISEKILWSSALKNQQEITLVSSDKNNILNYPNIQTFRTPRTKLHNMIEEVLENQRMFDRAMASLLSEKVSHSLNPKLKSIRMMGSDLKRSVSITTKYLMEEGEMVKKKNENDPSTNDKQNNQEFDISDCVSMKSEKYLSVVDSSGGNGIPGDILSVIKETDPIKFRLFSSSPVFQVIKVSNKPTRDSLPVPKDPNEKLKIWPIVKELIGKDLTKFSVPVQVNEPYSMLQRFGDSIEYWDLLNKANAQEDPCLRMAYVMAFGISWNSFPKERCGKPFNPLLGETFEFVDEEIGARFVSEQVSHHPPVSAGHADSRNFTFWMNTSVLTKFWGKSLEARPQGLTHCILKKYNDHYTFNRCKSVVYNILIGKTYIEHFGTLEFKNHTSGEEGEVVIIQPSWTRKNTYEIKGYIRDSEGNSQYTITGNYNKHFTIANVKTGETQRIWEIRPYPENMEWNYYFQHFSLQMNHIYLKQLPFLPPTDSRIRPDQLAVEYRLLDLATIEKNRLEEKQRAKRKENERQGVKYESKWFKEIKNSDNGEIAYEYKGGYWEAKDSQDFSQFPDIF